MTGTFNAYQKRTRETAIYPTYDHMGTMLYLGAKVSSEAGEVAGKIAKAYRDDGGIVTAERHESVISELGDVLWYVARLADELDEDLSDVASANLDKLAGRQARGTIGGDGDDR